MNVTVSVVIVSWNTRSLLLATLRSVLAQEIDGAVEVIVVDNGSSDGSVEAVRRTFPTVRLLTPGHNLGFAGGSNVGIQAARGRYTLLLNPDTVVRPGALQTLLDAAREHPRAAALQPKLLYPDGRVQYCWGYIPNLGHDLWLALAVNRWVTTPWWQAKAQSWRTVRPVRGVGMAALLVPRWVWARAGLLATEPFLYFEESDLSQRLQRRGWPMLLVPGAEVEHHLGQSTGQVPRRRRRAHYASRLWFYTAHRDKVSAWLVRNLSRARAALGIALASRRAARGDEEARRDLDELWRPLLGALRGGEGR